MMFTPTEEQIVYYVSSGLKNAEVAHMIGTSEGMVKNYLRIIFDKVGCFNRTELALWYVKRQTEKEGIE